MIDRRHIVTMKGGKDYALFAGVLDLAHDLGLKSIDTQLVQVPSEENGHTAIVRAVVTLGEKTFTAYGDANPRNVAPLVAGALIRMSETRAIGRALRWACNVGQTMLEELADLSEERQESRGDRYAREMPQEKFGATRAPIAGAAAAARVDRPLVRHEPGTVEGDSAMAQATPVCCVDGCGVVLRPAQVVLSEQKHGRRLCATHQESEAER